MSTADPIHQQFQLLTGREIPPSPLADFSTDPKIAFRAGGISYSQLNELLLSFSCDRVSKGFYNYFFLPPALRESGVDYNSETPHRISSLAHFEEGVKEFCKFAMLNFGNFKYAFNHFRRKTYEDISRELEEYKTVPEQNYTTRPVPIADLHRIPREHTYLLGYLAGKKVRDLEQKRHEGGILTSEEEALVDLRKEVVQRGIENYHIYLCSDYMDVYVATSMRLREEFYEVYEFIDKLFEDPEIKGLNLRYFDPTQADPQDRINKSLLEGLMVKRAKCTIYCAQESDTFGKDSELAATMAQGKPVIAYVPKVEDEASHARKLRDIAAQARNGEEVYYLKAMFLSRHADYVSNNPHILCEQSPEEEIALRLAQQDKELYDNRARTLKEIHPLSLQVNINSGVANGLLVVRDPKTCAKVLRRILLGTLDFAIEEQESEGGRRPGYYLRERITGSIFRVVTGDPLLTNTFWNFYHE